ncbi:MAG: hypothetical protein KDA96_26270, partial [Planctomycetaceae bacterium]|nr:hypothetical protein [Planctomycetaceae bacterium]
MTDVVDNEASFKITRGSIVRVAGVLLCLQLPAICGHHVAAEELSLRDERGAVPAWHVEEAPSTARVASQAVRDKGQSFQRFRIRNHGNSNVILAARQHVSVMHPELIATVRLHTTAAGIRSGLLILFPHQTDPRTGEPLVTILRGEIHRRADSWQDHTIAATAAAYESQMRRVRTELHRPDIDDRDATVIGVVLIVEPMPNDVFMDIGTVEFGPVVAPPAELSVSLPQPNRPDKPARVPFEVRLNTVYLNQQPAILQFIPDHGEGADFYSELGVNAVWAPDCRDDAHLSQLQNRGIAVLATPPHPKNDEENPARMQTSVSPLDQLCPHVSAWYVGTRVAPDQLMHLLSWSREIRNADRVLRRSLLADVAGAEGPASREIDLVGIS